MANLILNGDTSIITTGLNFMTFKTESDLKIYQVPVPKDDKDEAEKKPVQNPLSWTKSHAKQTKDELITKLYTYFNSAGPLL